MRRTICLLLTLLMLAFTMTGICTEYVQAKSANSQTYVLVHGAWHGAWCWDQIANNLRAEGHKVIAIDLPGHGQDKAPVNEQNLETYAQAVVKVLDQQKKPVILVGHSMGGAVMSQAAEYRPEKVKKLVYVTAFLLKDGQSVDGVTGLNPKDWFKIADTGAVVLSPDRKTTTATPDFAKEAFLHDVPSAVANKVIAQLSPEALAAHYGILHLTSHFESIPKIFVKCGQDRAVPPDVQDKMIQATPVEKVYSIPNSSHSPFLSHPKELTDILLDVATNL
ncbi:Pyrethroid hydrolase [Sporomusa rhizae]|uniref:alpha/beta fold hydrolase n=1 Tax=Sporomusa rhizae TaxID=357999 RepID=UPI00352A570B